MADPERKRREEEFLVEEDPHIRNAFLLIEKMVELVGQAPDVRALLDEILHSIFFWGRFHNPPLSPEDIVIDVQMLKVLKEDFPRPFVLCSSQLPRRSPFSSVLDMIVHLTGRENETKIIYRLRKLIRDLNLDEYLVSSTICVSHRTDVNDAVKYYGVSMSTPCSLPDSLPEGLPRKIMIAVCCLGSWDESVAGAVMTYFPTKKKNRDFDGTIKLPNHVRCQAFDLWDRGVKPPCRSCVNLFGLTPDESENESTEWVYGNCAEVESLSNLFKNVNDVKERARPKSRMYSDERRLKVERLVRTDLTNWLKQQKLIWKNIFYTPQ